MSQKRRQILYIILITLLLIGRDTQGHEIYLAANDAQFTWFKTS
jgi:hypothetical protein